MRHGSHKQDQERGRRFWTPGGARAVERRGQARVRSATHATPMVGLLALFAVLLHGCASFPRAAPGAAGPGRTISEITATGSAEGLTVVIKADQPLRYTFAQQDAAKALVIQFADTRLDRLGRFIFLPENAAVYSIRTEQALEDKSDSRLILALRDNLPYYLVSAGNSLIVAFTGASALAPSSAARQGLPEEPPPLPALAARSAGVTGLLKEVTISSRSGGVAVFMRVDGQLKDYKAFSIDAPPPARIVVDLEGLRSAFREEQRIAVEGGVVKQVRHLGYADKVRVVAETEKGYLDKFLLEPVENGLVLKVGVSEEKEN